MKSIILAIIIFPMHLFFLYSVFDIYFTSPIVSQVQEISATHKPLADRLVLYIIDGLRSNKLFVDEMKSTPFLRIKIIEGNSWGISNTRVPTETRPGHVALIAGFYEDVSSITKGWQENGVEFDSLFNRSSKTWSWGSPDVLPMFQKGPIPGKITTFCYKAELEDFAGNRTWELDTWVFNEVNKFLRNVIPNSDLDKQLRRKGVVFFLHLLGMDVSGHSQKPHSELYQKNLQIVSEGIENITKLIDNFYQDNRTAYIVTSDHGMTDWGSHGAGTIDETSTPIITWGSGFYNSHSSINKRNKPTCDISLIPIDNFPISKKSNSRQRDIWQADICALMASVLAIPIPINSVGVVPIDYLDGNYSVKAHIMRTNMRQLFIQYQTKYQLKKQNSLFHFQEFSELPMNKAYEQMENGEKLISENEFEAAIFLYQELSSKILDAISYFHKYDRLWLGFLSTSSFMLWIIYLATHIVQIVILDQPSFNIRKLMILVCLICIYTICTIVEQQPYSYILYRTVPTVILWTLFVFRWQHIRHLIKLLKNHAVFLICMILLVESIVWSFFNRQILLMGLIITYFIVLSTSSKTKTLFTKLKWTISCGLLMIYPYFPVISGDKNIYLVLIGGLLNCFLTTYVSLRHVTPVSFLTNFYNANGLMILINILTPCHVFYCQRRILSGDGLSFISQCFNWMILMFAIPLGCSTRTDAKHRIVMLFSALTVLYNLTAIYYELIFLFSLILFSISWQEIELAYRSENISAAVIDKRKIIQTVVYVFLLTYSFFATGNIASLNSFDVASTYCFVTIFRPFVMGFILLIKIMIPMMIISLVYVFIQQDQSENIQFLPFGPPTVFSKINKEEICLVTIVSDFAALHFLFMIKDSGSWLDIGTSISHYVITMAIGVCAYLFTLLSRLLLNAKLKSCEFHDLKSK